MPMTPGELYDHAMRAADDEGPAAAVAADRVGDGGAHLHLFFYARPEGFAQLRGTCLAIWDDLLPAVPPQMRDSDAATVARALVTSYGGTARV